MLQKGATKMHEGRSTLNKRFKKTLEKVLALVICLSIAITSQTVMSVRAAYREMLDIDRKGSISITFTYYDESTGKTYPVTNGNSVGLFKVANAVVDNGYKFVTDSRFATAGDIPSEDDALDAANLDLAEKMSKIARGYDFDITPKEIDEDGRVRFEDLDVGLYLVLQASQGKGEDNKYVITPFLISIPCRNPDGSLLYDVDAKSKPIGIAKEKKPSPPKPPIIPQTSQLWWPVMALGAVGLLFLFAGMVRKKRSS